MAEPLADAWSCAGASPRHLYVANALCEAADVLAIVQETGWRVEPGRSLLRTLRPDNLLRKAWRWLRDRRRYYRQPRGDSSSSVTAPPRLDHPELLKKCRTSITRIVVRLARELKPT